MATGPLDAAILDIGLGDGRVFPLARMLREQGIPFDFLSGYGPAIVPDEFGDVPFLEKPVPVNAVVNQLGAVLSRHVN